MNNANFYGRIVRDLVTSGEGDKMVARTTLAVDRIKKIEGQPDADYIPLVFFGARARAAVQYIKKGFRFACTTHVQTGSYTNKEGQKVYTTEFIVDTMNFIEKKESSQQPVPVSQVQSFPSNSQSAPPSASVPNSNNSVSSSPSATNSADEFASFIPDLNDMDLPWNQ